VAWSETVSCIVNWDELTNVALCATPLKVTVELERKFVPLMVRVCAVAPAVAEVGDRVVMAGTGLVMIVEAPPQPVARISKPQIIPRTYPS
jgi:hypothetical protein